ncbi:hypothetical protein JF531_14065 [Microbacterium esteraromaticum]|uniref:hypothetical protein n=1 Tax=Microbacterium esteraromaticum TaxID=57043 RepID=UPI001A8E0721|nr:hypothetical protein [Microbacterium esteraromaticum]MBN8425643.1 hypothetical protein [Microbacterium esteraromaticum]
MLLVTDLAAFVLAAVALYGIPAISSEAAAVLLEHQDDHHNEVQKQLWHRALQEIGRELA